MNYCCTKVRNLKNARNKLRSKLSLSLMKKLKLCKAIVEVFWFIFMFVNIGKPTREMPNNLLIPTEESKSYRPDDKTVGSKDDSMPPSDTLDQTKDTPVDNMDLEEAKESDGFSA